MRKKIDPIPEEFSSYEEAAEFWDTHDTTEYLQSSHPVKPEPDDDMLDEYDFSGGVRVIYYFKKKDDEIWLLAIYSKNERETIPAHVLREIAKEIENVHT